MSHIPVQAMVLAAGLGKRMRPLTDTCPKPLIEVAGRSMIDRALDRLEEAGVSTVVVNTSYLAQQLEDHLAKRHSPHIIISREETPLETGGGVAQALGHFGDEPFFVVNGDIIWRDTETPLALERLAKSFDESLDAVLLLHPVVDAIGYDGVGDFFVENDMLVRRGTRATAPYVYAGVQLLHPRLFEDAPTGAFSLNVLYDRALQANPPRIRAVIHEGEWLHVGDVSGKNLADAHLKAV